MIFDRNFLLKFKKIETNKIVEYTINQMILGLASIGMYFSAPKALKGLLAPYSWIIFIEK